MPLSSAKGRAGFWIGIALTVGLVGWALASYDFTRVWEALKEANYWWVLPAAIIEVGVIFIRAVRWRSFLEPIKKVSLYDSSMGCYIGFTGNMILPARAGEFIRAWVLARKVKVPATAVMGTVVIERVVDGLTVVMVIFLTLLMVDVPEEKQAYWETMRATGFLFTFAFVGMSVGAVMLQKRVGWVVRTMDFTIGLLPERFRGRVKGLIETFLSGFDFLEHSRHIVGIIFWSAVFWGVSGGLNICFFMAFGLDLPFIATYLILIAQVIGVMAPSPGFVGPYHAATIAALSFYGVDAELALSMALVMHATMFLTNSLPGVFFLLNENLSLGQISHAADEEREEG